MAISNTPRSFGADAARGNSLVTATLNVEVDAGAVALVWSVTPRAGASIATLTALLGTLVGGVLQSEFCGADYPVTGSGPLNGTLSGTAACFAPPPTAETVAILTGQVNGPGGGMFFFTQPFSL